MYATSQWGPRLVVDLDEVDTSELTLSAEATYVYRDALWVCELACCVACHHDNDAVPLRTLRHVADAHRFVCLTHGELEEVTMSVRRDFVIKIGTAYERTGSQEVNDVILMPRNLTAQQRHELCEGLVGCAADAEAAEDLLSDDA